VIDPAPKAGLFLGYIGGERIVRSDGRTQFRKFAAFEGTIAVPIAEAAE
jgi:hypothetical protein